MKAAQYTNTRVAWLTGLCILLGTACGVDANPGVTSSNGKTTIHDVKLAAAPDGQVTVSGVLDNGEAVERTLPEGAVRIQQSESPTSASSQQSELSAPEGVGVSVQALRPICGICVCDAYGCDCVFWEC